MNRTVVVGGMPGCQIALIAAVAALFAAAAAVLAYRVLAHPPPRQWTAHRRSLVCGPIEHDRDRHQRP